MDSRGDTGYVHGEIIGIPVNEKDVYCDAVDYIERGFSSSDSELIRLCIGDPHEKANKVQFEKKIAYRRVGSKTEPVADLSDFYQHISFRDAQREEAEKMHNFTAPELCQNLGKKLVMLITRYAGHYNVTLSIPFSSSQIRQIFFPSNKEYTNLYQRS
ncbi:Sterile alpha motif domain-containing protein 9-like [Labeo rohita]|uniref:Sterile alpha motif domain-containing protein 9-like n=1 Tax=Labeo rohita TaxID=84645 RepID=A0ABQ8LY71_LABRO|nr:Sterile alpha motif domain-containing protein 9-like [Labeo rohita]